MINVLLRTKWIIVCFIEIGNLLVLRKSDTFDIKPRVEISIVKLATVLSAIKELQHLDKPMYLLTLYCFDVIMLVSLHTVSSQVFTDMSSTSAISGR